MRKETPKIYFVQSQELGLPAQAAPPRVLSTHPTPPSLNAGPPQPPLPLPLLLKERVVREVAKMEAKRRIVVVEKVAIRANDPTVHPGPKNPSSLPSSRSTTPSELRQK
jgi:hypothetical protein